jgi:uncharacterized protein (TIGR00730 family)
VTGQNELEIRRICVFCGSSVGVDPQYRSAAQELAQLMVSERIGLVYGGGRVGLMGVVADAVIEAGGSATGVIPHALWEREVGHTGLHELEIVDTMHERKARMAELSDAFVAMPGGIGTMEELFEVWTWAQLGIHGKPCALLNVDGFYDPLVDFVDHLVERGFLRPQHRAMLLVESEPDALLRRLRGYQPPAVQKWTNLSGS